MYFCEDAVSRQSCPVCKVGPVVAALLMWHIRVSGRAVHPSATQAQPARREHSSGPARQIVRPEGAAASFRVRALSISTSACGLPTCRPSMRPLRRADHPHRAQLGCSTPSWSLAIGRGQKTGLFLLHSLVSLFRLLNNPRLQADLALWGLVNETRVCNDGRGQHASRAGAGPQACPRARCREREESDQAAATLLLRSRSLAAASERARREVLTRRCRSPKSFRGGRTRSSPKPFPNSLPLI